jgi:transposase
LDYLCDQHHARAEFLRWQACHEGVEPSVLVSNETGHHKNLVCEGEETIMTKPFSTSSNGFTPRASHTRSSEIVPTPQRRTRSAAEKLRILQAYEAAPSGTSERGALLRREGIYSSQISKWRKLRDQGKLGTLSPQRRGPKAAPRELLADELDALRKENARLQARLTRAEAIIDVQKKVAHLLGTSLPSLPADEM